MNDDYNSYSSSSNFGGINLYITGVAILDSTVELISPPINTIAKGAISGFGVRVIGSNPQRILNLYTRQTNKANNGNQRHLVR